MALIGANLLKVFTNYSKQSICQALLVPCRNYSYQRSLFLEDVTVKAKYDIVKNPEEWKYVERILPRDLVPEPTPKTVYPSGWRPQGQIASDSPYYIRRTKNHMMPVYLITKQRGQVRHTVIRYIQGDIWQLEKDLRPFLEDINKPMPLRLQVNEFRGQILMNGDFVNAIKHWLGQKNL